MDLAVAVEPVAGSTVDYSACIADSAVVAGIAEVVVVPELVDIVAAVVVLVAVDQNEHSLI